MTRKAPTLSVPDVKKAEERDWINQTRSYKVITPLYGGGEEPGKPDSVTVVRASEIRGHLRFWWRATRGGAFNGGLEAMRKREEQIWGSSGGKNKDGNPKPGPSQVVVQLTSWKEGTRKATEPNPSKKGPPQISIADPRAKWSYVAFPLRKEEARDGKKGKEAGEVHEDVSFQIALSFPRSILEEIEPALWAWETFGGIGARTRRGFGALQCISSSGDQQPSNKSVANVESQLDKELMKFVEQGTWPKGVPHLIQGLVYRVIPETNPMQAWEALIRALRGFRQEKARAKLDENSGKIIADKFGFSQWPEANEIRRLINGDPKEIDGDQEPAVRKFPRAVFGLPLPFNMHHDKGLRDKRISLEGKGKIDRLASPLILRPIICSDGAVGLAAILEWEPMGKDDGVFSPPGGLELKTFKKDFPVRSKLTATEAKQIPPMGKTNDVLQAFLNFIEKEDVRRK